jgi:hypothetical protein
MENKEIKNNNKKNFWKILKIIFLYIFWLYLYWEIFWWLKQFNSDYLVSFYSQIKLLVLFIVMSIASYVYYLKYIKNKELYKKILFWLYIFFFSFLNIILFLLINCSCRS